LAKEHIMSRGCPKCGFVFSWDGAICRHCHYSLAPAEGVVEAPVPKIAETPHAGVDLPESPRQPIKMGLGCILAAIKFFGLL
jgi:uncharacterized OB-fold protein